MALSTPTPHVRPPARHMRRDHFTLFLISGALGAGAIALVTYLLWPTWTERADDPSHLPVSIGDTLFNVPTRAVRVSLQRRSGPQERVDLNFVYPSLEVPEALPHIASDIVENSPPPIDHIFLSIAAHRNALAPDERVRTIYPRYLDPGPAHTTDGLSVRPFRDTTPYAGEDLFTTDNPQIIARCTRDAATPGMCLSERRINGADLTFRFPRSWLVQWREVASALDQLVSRLLSPRN